MIGRPRRRVYDWNQKDYPEFYGQTREQVWAMEGKFYSPGGSWVVPECETATWFVPTSGTKPVMVLMKNGLWSARGF